MNLLSVLVVLSAFLVVGILGKAVGSELEVSILHFNDFHARFDEQSSTSGTCKPGMVCHGGFSRLYQAVHDLKGKRKNAILLDAGDDFQGTLWYNLFKWNVTQQFLNLLPITAHTIGNHEFDDEIAGLVPFLNHMKATTLACNLDDSAEPSMQGLHQKSIILNFEGKKLAIVGVALASANEISNTGNLIFEDEISAVNREVDRLVTEENVFSAIVLSHAGYETDQLIAKYSTKKIAAIVGGHSHTLLYNGTAPDGSEPLGTYPKVIRRESDGQMVPIVQASAYTKFLGDFQLVINANGEAGTWSGQPLYLGPDFPKNETIEKLLDPYRKIVHETGASVLGTSEVLLNKMDCYEAECNLGNFITDVMVAAYNEPGVDPNWKGASLAVMNAGGIRSSIPIGNITYEDMITSQPFGNYFDVGLVNGTGILQILEKTAEAFNFGTIYSNINLLQLSGFRVQYDLSKPFGRRVRSVLIREGAKFEALQMRKDYRLIVPSFLGKGGDGFYVIPQNLRNYTKGPFDMDSFQKILPKLSPIKTGLESRISFVGQTKPFMISLS